MDNKYLLARNLRKNMTPQERKLWSKIRNKQFHGLAFRRQYPMGEYIVDFICREIKLIIEIDGGQHNFNENIEYDTKRTQFLNSLGYEVIRFWDNDINNNIEGVMQYLEAKISPHLNPFL